VQRRDATLSRTGSKASATYGVRRYLEPKHRLIGKVLFTGTLMKADRSCRIYVFIYLSNPTFADRDYCFGLSVVDMQRQAVFP
jgi:hypothetical protein